MYDNSINERHIPSTGKRIGGDTGSETISVCQKITIPIRRPGTRFRVSDPKPGSSRGSFLNPEKCTCKPASQVLLSVLDPEPGCRVLDSGEKWVVWNGCICKAILHSWMEDVKRILLSQSAPCSHKVMRLIFSYVTFGHSLYRRCFVKSKQCLFYNESFEFQNTIYSVCVTSAMFNTVPYPARRCTGSWLMPALMCASLPSGDGVIHRS